MKVAAYHGLNILYNEIGVMDSSAKYTILAYDANDSAYQENTTATVLKFQSLYNYSRHQDVARQSAEQTASLQRWLFRHVCAGGGSCLLHFINLQKKKLAVQKKMTLMRIGMKTEKNAVAKEMEEMYALLEERQSLLESKDEQLERKKMN